MERSRPTTQYLTLVRRAAFVGRDGGGGEPAFVDAAGETRQSVAETAASPSGSVKLMSVASISETGPETDRHLDSDCPSTIDLWDGFEQEGTLGKPWEREIDALVDPSVSRRRPT